MYVNIVSLPLVVTVGDPVVVPVYSEVKSLSITTPLPPAPDIAEPLFCPPVPPPPPPVFAVPAVPLSFAPVHPPLPPPPAPP